MHTHSHTVAPQGQHSFGPELAFFHMLGAAPKEPQRARRVCIETAHSETQHRGANRLLQQRYHWRGYRAVSLPQTGLALHLPLTASREGQVIGTLTVGFDSPRGLNCDQSFAQEVQALRAAGQRLCEFTKLAVQAEEGSVQVLAALFHVAFLAARNLRRVDTVLLEVNPRHVRYYQRMLGAEVIGQERANACVDAPAVLLAIPSAHIRQQIDQAAWSREARAAARTLYTQAFNRAEEGAIVARLAIHLSEQTAPVRAAPGLAEERPFAFRLPSTAAAVSAKAA